MPPRTSGPCSAGVKSGRRKTLDIMGGEPTMHPDIVPMSRMRQDAGFGQYQLERIEPPVLEEIMRRWEAGYGRRLGQRPKDARAGLERFVRKHAPVVKSVFGPAMDTGMIQPILSLGPKKFYLIYRDALDPRELEGHVPFHRFVAAVEQRFDARSVGMVFCSGFVPDTGN